MKNLCELLQESSNRYPDHIYIQDKNVNYTYQEVFHRVRTMASILTNKYQISANDCVMLYIENSVEYVIAFFSVLYIGATAVPLNTNLGSDLFQLVSEETKSKYIISSRQLIGKAKKSLPETVSNIMMNLEELRDSTSLKNESIKMNSTAEVAMIIYTSGTTSKAKGVMLSHENLLTIKDSILRYLPINNKSVILAIMSFTYSYGNSILLTHTKAGGCIKIYNMSAYIS